MIRSQINFAAPSVQRGRQLRSRGMLLFVGGGALVVYAAVRWANVVQEEVTVLGALRAASTSSMQLAPNPPSVSAGIPAPRAVAANAAIRRMNVPWRDLLDAVEQATPADIAIVELDPVPSQNELMLEAEARNLEAMTAYVDQLQKATFFDQVVLTRHAIDEHDTNHPIRFLLHAHWNPSTRGTL